MPEQPERRAFSKLQLSHIRPGIIHTGGYIIDPDGRWRVVDYDSELETWFTVKDDGDEGSADADG